MSRNAERVILVALFAKRDRLSEWLAQQEVLVNKVEFVADRAVVVSKGRDGALTITHSEHSPGRTVAAVAAKLLIALPLGFQGALAAANAGRELEAAGRSRGDALAETEEHLAALAEQMQPGWSAVVAAYGPQQAQRAVEAFQRFGAAEVWSAPEPVVLAPAEYPLDEDAG